MPHNRAIAACASLNGNKVIRKNTFIDERIMLR